MRKGPWGVGRASTAAESSPRRCAGRSAAAYGSSVAAGVPWGLFWREGRGIGDAPCRSFLGNRIDRVTSLRNV